jgi:serine/threonine protein kinase
MELIDGVDFIRYVTNDVAFEPDRLRRSLRQLVEGVYALHQARKLHCDLKPSNLLVTKDGRVVILDFGLTTEIAVNPPDESAVIIGTPDYMSPEQAAGKPLSEASDSYSVGAILYRSLTGRLPIIARTREILARKQDADIPPPSALMAGIPQDLDLLCRDLLRSDPGARPSGQEVLERLGGPETADIGDAPGLPRLISETPFVGREKELDELRQSFEFVRGGRAAIVYVYGGSGTGKTALVGHFLQELKNDGSAVVPAGRCYERESVPYKALDSLVDELTQYLIGLPRSLVEALVPAGVAALARLFPVLERVRTLRPIRPE